MKKGLKSLQESVMRAQLDYRTCEKYKWILERAKHYAEKCNKTTEQVLEIWERDRTYSYQNYYQEANQPLLDSENIMPFNDWITELKKRFGDDGKKWAFKCPSCGNIQTANDFIENGVEKPEDKVYFNCIGRYVSNLGCNWSLGGLFSIHTVSVLKNAKVFPVFEMADDPATERVE